MTESISKPDVHAPKEERSQHPEALVKQRSHRTWVAFLLPLFAIAVSLWAGLSQWQRQGMLIEITFPNAHGLKPGNPVRYRGVVAGEVQAIDLKSDLSGVRATVRLFTGNHKLARAGSTFWVVRPQFNSSGLQGLDTVIGARYIAVQPGQGKPQTHFKGLARPRPYTQIKPGELDLVFVSHHAQNLNEGASISYRGIVVGSVLSVRLGPGGRTVEAYARIYRPYTGLIRPDTVFWSLKPIKANMNVWRMLLPWLETQLEIGKPKTFLFGGIALAVPTQSKEKSVASGHQFKLLEKPPEQVETWKPLLRIGSQFLPKATKLACQVKAHVSWVEKGFFRRKHPKTRAGWLTLVRQSLWGPSVLFPKEKDLLDRATLEISGVSIPTRRIAITRHPDNPMLLQIQIPYSFQQKVLRKTCPTFQPPRSLKAQDLVLVTGRDLEQPLSKTQLKQIQENKRSVLLLHNLAPLGQVFQGAAAFARDSGALVGLLVLENNKMKIYPIYTQYIPNRCRLQQSCRKVKKTEVLKDCAVTCINRCCKKNQSSSCLKPEQQSLCMQPCQKACVKSHSGTICKEISLCPKGKATQKLGVPAKPTKQGKK